MDGRSRNEMMMKNLGREEEEEEERELELRLGPPGGKEWSHNENKRGRNESLSSSSLGYKYFSTQKTREELHAAENKASENTALPNISHKRTSPASSVVGWPPIRSFRKNLGSGGGSCSSNSKHPPGPHHQQHHHHPLVQDNKVVGAVKENVHNNNKGLFVKINMDGVPIGRKVDINAYGSYHQLSSSVDNLFRDLLPAQRDSSAGGSDNKKEEQEKVITCVLDGSGEYTLVYEDNEGDKMLVGDVPWNMFVSTVKRLRVLKTCDLSAFSVRSKQGRPYTPLLKRH